MSSKRNVNPDHYKVAGRDRQSEDILHHQQKMAYGMPRAFKNDVSSRPPLPGEPTLTVPGAKSSGKVKSRATRPSRAASRDSLPKSEVFSGQSSGKRGTRSMAQKQERSRHDVEPTPATTPVAGAFGKTGRLSETEDEIIDTEPKDEPGDFLERRRKENKKARK